MLPSGPSSISRAWPFYESEGLTGLATLRSFPRVAVLRFEALLLGLLVVAVRDGITVAGGVFGLICLGILLIGGSVIADYKARAFEAEGAEDDDDERLHPAVLIAILVVVFICFAFATTAKLYEEGIDVSDWFPLTEFSPLTVLGPFLIISFVVVDVVGRFIRDRLKPKVVAWASRFEG